MEPILIDTSVIIGVLRQHYNALRLAESVKGRPKAVTDAVVGELLAGARDKREFFALHRHLEDNFIWLSTNERPHFSAVSCCDTVLIRAYTWSISRSQPAPWPTTFLC